MRLYKTIYENREGFTQTNMFFILNDEERDLLGDMVEILEEDIAEGRKAKRIKRWTNWDDDSINFLRRCCHYGKFEEAEMMDLSSKQYFNFIEKTLRKVYGIGMNFERWMDVSIDDSKREGWMTNDEARENMDHKRRLLALYQKREAIKAAKASNHSELRNAHIKAPK